MTVIRHRDPDGTKVEVNLRKPLLAAFLAWLWPGAGHFYQHRYTKGFLFMICILGTFFYGLGLGKGRVVYASLRPNDVRWQYFLQVGVGTPSLFAMVQSAVVRGGGDPLIVTNYRYPENAEDASGVLREFEIIENLQEYGDLKRTIKDGFMAPPKGPVYLEDKDVLGMWHLELGHRFDIATYFTVIAGLLNLLAIYDAYAGPAFPEERRKKKKKRRRTESETPE